MKLGHAIYTDQEQRRAWGIDDDGDALAQIGNILRDAGFSVLMCQHAARVSLSRRVTIGEINDALHAAGLSAGKYRVVRNRSENVTIYPII